jgi:hypothetical protein
VVGATHATATTIVEYKCFYSGEAAPLPSPTGKVAFLLAKMPDEAKTKDNHITPIFHFTTTHPGLLQYLKIKITFLYSLSQFTKYLSAISTPE